LDMRIFLCNLLGTCGYAPIDAGDRKEGLQKAREEKPDLIILDVMMPKEGGIQMYRDLKQDRDLKQVPVIMLSGDNAIVEEARGLLGDIEGAVVKQALSFHSAKTLVPAAACDLIRQKVSVAMQRLDEFAPYDLEAPVELEVSFKHYQPAQLLAYLSIVEQVDSHTIRFVGKDMVEISKFLQFILDYQVPLAP